MVDRTDADDLLAIAREALLAELLPVLPSEAQYTARMVANAIAIARREQSCPALDAALAAELGTLAGIAEPASDASPWRVLLAQRIRDGVFDGDRASDARLLGALQRWTRTRVALANPRVLELPIA